MPGDVIADLLICALESIYYLIVVQLLPQLWSNLQNSLFREILHEVFDEKAL